MTYLLIPVLDLQSCCFSFSWSAFSLFSLPQTCPRLNILVNLYPHRLVHGNADVGKCLCLLSVSVLQAVQSSTTAKQEAAEGLRSVQLLCTKSVQLFISDWEFCSIRSFGEASITFCKSKDQNNISFYMKRLFRWAIPLLFPYVHFVTFLLTRVFYIYLC